MPIYRFEYPRAPSVRMQYERSEALDIFGPTAMAALDQGLVVKHGDATVVDLEAYFVAHQMQATAGPEEPRQPKEAA